MYYLRKKAYEVTIPEIIKTDGTVIPERKYMSDERAIYKHNNFSRWYRGAFTSLEGKYQGMRVYRCKTLKKILKVQKIILRATGEYFDVYNENGLVTINRPLS